MDTQRNGWIGWRFGRAWFGPGRGWWVVMMVMMVLGLGVGVGREARATRMVPMTVEQLAATSTAVVHGRVVALESARDGEGRIYSRVDLRVLEVWRGTVASEVCQVVMGGGILGDRSVSVAGQAAYRVGEEVVAYLVRNPAGEWVTVGLSQGRFAVRRELDTGRSWVSNGFLGGRSGSGSGGTSAARSLMFPGDRAMSLEELKLRTREVQP